MLVQIVIHCKKKKLVVLFFHRIPTQNNIHVGELSGLTVALAVFPCLFTNGPGGLKVALV